RNPAPLADEAAVAIVLEAIDLLVRGALHPRERRVRARVEERHRVGLERRELLIDLVLGLLEDLRDRVGDLLPLGLVLLLGELGPGFFFSGCRVSPRRGPPPRPCPRRRSRPPWPD